MRVQRLVMPGSAAESWTLLGDDHLPVEPVERFLAYLSAIERSPNTVKAYALDLKDWFVFLGGRSVDWATVTLEDVAAFVAWLRLPPAGRAGQVAVLPSAETYCGAASVNRKLAALTSFCEFHARHGVPLAGLLLTMTPAGGRRPGSATAFKPFLHHISKSGPQRRRTVTIPAPTPRAQVLTAGQVRAILDACEHLRDRLLFGLLLDTGLRIGEVLGLRHEDLEIAERQVRVVPRRNDNRARAKGGRSRTVPASVDVLRLYADYLNAEYGALDSDYVFVNLFGRPHGHPLTYPAVYDLVGRLRRRTGLMFGPHMFRHTYATWLLRRGAGMESVKELLGHASITTTVDIYGPDGRRRPPGIGGRGLVHRAGGPVVTPAEDRKVPAGAGLLGRLLAGVRPQFRVEVYLPDPDDRVLGRPSCIVAGCDRSGWEYGLCSSHGRRWRAAGCPDLPVFLADPGPPLHGRIELPACTVPGCRYGTNSLGLCLRHRGYYTRSGHPDPAAWAADRPTVPDEDHVQCRLPFCTLWTEHSRQLFCRSHQNRWRQLGCPDVDDFIDHCLTRGKARIDFHGLPPQLKLEFQYAVQYRFDQKSITASPPVVNWAIRIAGDAGVSSLLDHDEDRWLEITASKSTSTYQSFLLHARTVVETLRDGSGWDVEYPRDIWRLHTLPGLVPNPGKIAGARNHLRFDRIAQPWLRDLAKRWCRLRLTSGLAVGTVLTDMNVLIRFSRFLEQSIPTVDALAGIDRLLLERYLAWIADELDSQTMKEDAVTCINTFFRAIRQHGWDPTLPTTAVFFTGDSPGRPPRESRRLSEHVMAQVEAPANLDRWPHPQYRLLTLILVRCGLRASDACTLDFDCLIHDGQGAPYLRYRNHKMRREAAVPIDEELQAEIRAQQTTVASNWPGAHPHLFPALKGNADGQLAMTYYSYRIMLNKWLQICDIRDEQGDPVHLTPHQWRHTFASRLINRDVPQEVVRVLLDHESTEMTAHYARITNQTVRRKWEQATKVNVQGERIVIDPDGPLAQAQWAKTRHGIATQTRPHGYCGLPVQKSCPHANACLTCPVFITGPEFLPELREHRGRTLTLIQTAETAGHARVAQMNQQVLTNLDRMINSIQTTSEPTDLEGQADAS